MKYLIFLLTFCPLIIFGQNKPQNHLLSNQTKEELKLLTKELFTINSTISFNISSQDAQTSFKKIPDAKVYDDQYLKRLNDLITKDSNNPIYLQNLAEYYQNKSESDRANFYFSKAKDKLAIKYFHKDSASYYSYRGIIKMNLGDTTAILDFDRSIHLNPNDSLSLYFYPMILISNKNFTKANEIIQGLFKSKLMKQPLLPYFYLTLSEIFTSFQKSLSVIETDKKSKQEYAKKNYQELINYQLLDQYAFKNKGNIEIENVRLMADLYGLFYKMLFFEFDSNNTVIFQYTDFENGKLREIITKLEDLNKKKQLNEYTSNKCLGYAYFMLNEPDKSLQYFQNALAVFPNSKKNQYFQSYECFDAISLIYYNQSDTLNFRKTIFNKMKTEENEVDHADELTLLAFDYFRFGELEKSEEFCKKVRELNPDNFDALRLLSHLNFLKGRKKLTEFFAQIASNLVTNDDEGYELSMQFAIYFTYYGDFENALKNINSAKSLLGNEDCSICDKLNSIIQQN